MSTTRAIAALLFAGTAACHLAAETELQKAVKAHDAGAVKRLLDAGADTGGSWADRTTARKLAFTEADAGNPDALEVLRLFLVADPRPVAIGTAEPPPALVDSVFANPCRQPPCGSISAIEIVVRLWNLDAVQLMIDSGLTMSNPGVTDALVYAIAEGNDEAAKRLVEAGADPGATASGGNRYGKVSALEAARLRENTALIEWLRAHGAR